MRSSSAAKSSNGQESLPVMARAAVLAEAENAEGSAEAAGASARAAPPLLPVPVAAPGGSSPPELPGFPGVLGPELPGVTGSALTLPVVLELPSTHTEFPLAPPGAG